MLPGKSCTRFWVPGGSQGSQEGGPCLPGGNTPAVRPFGLQGESPLVAGPHMGPNTGLCSNHHPRFCACCPGNLAQHVVVILRSQVFSAFGGMRVWRHYPRETLFRVSGERPSCVYCSSALIADAVVLHAPINACSPGMHAWRDVQIMRSGVFLHTCIYAYVGILPRETLFRVFGETPFRSMCRWSKYYNH